MAAVTEAIVNAVCHRDYTSNASVQIMLFNDRLEIWNPGQLPYGLTVEMLKTNHSSLPTNPLLARPMYLYGAIEQMGTGTEMIISTCLEQGLKAPDFEQKENFKVIFGRNVVEDSEDNGLDDAIGGQTGGQTGGQILSEMQKKIIDIMIENPKVSRKEISNKLNINVSAVQKHIETLKKSAIICREGADFGGYWKFIQNNS